MNDPNPNFAAEDAIVSGGDFASQNERLEWTAARHVLGELGPGEQLEFDERLGADQAARDAVARQAVLVDSLARGGEVVRPQRPRRKAFIGIAAAASAAAVTLLLMQSASLDPPVEQAANGRQAIDQPREAEQPEEVTADTDDLTDEQMLAYWVEAAEEPILTADELDHDAHIEREIERLSRVVRSLSEPKEGDQSRIEPPSWMLAALLRGEDDSRSDSEQEGAETGRGELPEIGAATEDAVGVNADGGIDAGDAGLLELRGGGTP